jgi:diguanylate cyclase (GGDEF)-like protein
MGSLALFVQIAGVALVLAVWTVVRQRSRRRRFDAWWLAMLALVLGLVAYAVGILTARTVDGNTIAPALTIVYATLEYVAAFYLYIGACNLARREPVAHSPILLVAAILMYAMLTLYGVPFLESFAFHLLILGVTYAATTIVLVPTTRLAGGSGMQIVTIALGILAITFLSHVPLVVLAVVKHATPSALNGAYTAINGYVTMLAEMILVIGMLVAEIDRVTDALQVANARLLAAQVRLDELVQTDALTGLRNRGALERARAAGRFDAGYVVCLDLDGLKGINDRHGHPIGDRAIRTFADALRTCAEDGESAFRIGGDEFVLVFTAESEREIVLRLEAMQRTLSLSLDDGTELRLFGSFGIAFFEDASALAPAIALADARLYAHKARGR